MYFRKKAARKARHAESGERTKHATEGADGSITKKSKCADDGSDKAKKKSKTLTALSSTDKVTELRACAGACAGGRACGGAG